MPFFKKTAHNRCSVALCAVLVPILTFSLGANLVTLHCEAVSFFAGAACDYNNFFAHKIYPPYDSGIDFSLFRYYHNSKNEMKIKYAQLSAILKFV